MQTYAVWPYWQLQGPQFLLVELAGCMDPRKFAPHQTARHLTCACFPHDAHADGHQFAAAPLGGALYAAQHAVLMGLLPCTPVSPHRSAARLHAVYDRNKVVNLCRVEEHAHSHRMLQQDRASQVDNAAAARHGRQYENTMAERHGPDRASTQSCSPICVHCLAAVAADPTKNRVSSARQQAQQWLTW